MYLFTEEELLSTFGTVDIKILEKFKTSSYDIIQYNKIRTNMLLEKYYIDDITLDYINKSDLIDKMLNVHTILTNSIKTEYKVLIEYNNSLHLTIFDYTEDNKCDKSFDDIIIDKDIMMLMNFSTYNMKCFYDIFDKPDIMVMDKILSKNIVEDLITFIYFIKRKYLLNKKPSLSLCDVSLVTVFINLSIQYDDYDECSDTLLDYLISNNIIYLHINFLLDVL